MAWASSYDLKRITPRGYLRGASFQNLAQCLTNRSNPSSALLRIGAAFISSIERYLSTDTLLLLEIELLPQCYSVSMVQRTNRGALELIQRHRRGKVNMNAVNFFDHGLNTLE